MMELAARDSRQTYVTRSDKCTKEPSNYWANFRPIPLLYVLLIAVLYIIQLGRGTFSCTDVSREDVLTQIRGVNALTLTVRQWSHPVSAAWKSKQSKIQDVFTYIWGLRVLHSAINPLLDGVEDVGSVASKFSCGFDVIHQFDVSPAPAHKIFSSGSCEVARTAGECEKSWDLLI